MGLEELVGIDEIDGKVSIADTGLAGRMVGAQQGRDADSYRLRLYGRLLDDLDPSLDEDRKTALNLLTSLFRFGRLRLARRLWIAFGNRLLEFVHQEPDGATLIRSQWAERLAWIGEYQLAHDVILGTRPDEGTAGLRLELVNARIFAQRLHTSGRPWFFEWAEWAIDSLLAKIENAPAAPRLTSLFDSAIHCWIGAARTAGRLEDRTRIISARAERRPSPGGSAFGQIERITREPALGTRLSSVADAERLLNLGMFEEAAKAVDDAARELPDSRQVVLLQARLAHEQGQFKVAAQILHHARMELFGDEDLLFRCRQLDCLLELRWAGGPKNNKELRQIEAPIRDGHPRAHERLPRYLHYLISLELKACLYLVTTKGKKWPRKGVKEKDEEWTLERRLAKLAAEPPIRPLPAALFNLIAKGYASLNRYDQARTFAEKSLQSAEGHDRVITLNTIADLLMQDSGFTMPELARTYLLESLDIEPDNRLTLSLLSRTTG